MVILPKAVFTRLGQKAIKVTTLIRGSLSFQTNRSKRKKIVLKTTQERLLRDMKLPQVNRAVISKLIRGAF